MTTQQEMNKARVRDYIGNVVNKHVPDRFPEYIAEESVDHSAPAGMPGGPEGTRMFFSMFYAGSSDMSNEIYEMMAEDDNVAFASIVSGTHDGMLMGMPPTGKKFRVLLMETVRLRDGKYVEHWGGMDIATMMAQINAPADVDLVAALPGLLPSQAETAGNGDLTANKEAAVRLFNMIFVDRALDGLGDFFADPLHSLNQTVVTETLAEIKAYFQTLLDAFPDMSATIDGVMGERDLVALRVDMRGTHTGPYMGVPGTGKPFSVSSMHFFRFAGGKIVQRWEWMDRLALAQQLGLMPGNAAAEAEQNKAELFTSLVDLYIAGVNEDDPEKLRAAFAPDFVDHVNAQVSGLPPGNEAVVVAHRQLHDSFPDVTFTVDEYTIEDDKIAIRVHASGTHEGNFYGFPATGKLITWAAHRILRVENGQFVEAWNEFDQVSILQQIGIIPSFVPAPDPKANKAAVQRLFDELNAGNLNVIDEIVTIDFVMHGDALNPDLKGRDALKMTEGYMRFVFPDLKVEVSLAVAEGDRVVARLRSTGTHSQPFAGMPASGKVMSWTGMGTFRFENGKLAERWYNSDGFGLLQQFGMIPS